MIFFFQAEDGIRDRDVTGVQTCALPISRPHESARRLDALRLAARGVALSACQTARALVRPGEEWFGFPRSLLLAGAGAVLRSEERRVGNESRCRHGATYRQLKSTESEKR